MDEYAKVAASVGDYDNYKQIWNGYADVYIDPTSLNEYLPGWIFVAAKVTSLPDKEWECGYMKTSDLNLDGITLTPSQNTYPVYTNDQRIQVSLMNSPANNVDLNDVKWMEMLGTATSIGVLKLDFYKQVTASLHNHVKGLIHGFRWFCLCKIRYFNSTRFGWKINRLC